MLDVCTPRSLVFIDELGRGTEATHGTAMGGAVVEALDAAGVRGVFATHLHGLLDLDLDISPYVRRMRMETVAGEAGRVMPTWRMVPGECRESLALQTATDMGVSDAVVRRAEALLLQLRAMDAHKDVAADTACICDGAPRAPAPPLEALRDLLGDTAMRIPAFESKPGAAAGAAGSVRDWLGTVGPDRCCSPSHMMPFLFNPKANWS